MNTRPFFAIVLKDLKLHCGNRRALILTLAVPIAIATFFGSIFGGGSGKSKPSGVPLEIVDLDRSAVSREIITNLGKDASLMIYLVDENHARQDLREGKAAVAVIFPKNFGEDAGRAFFRPGAKPEITLLHDPSRNIEASMVQGILTQHIMETVSRQVFSGQSGRKYAQEGFTNLSQAPSGWISGENRGALSNLLSSVDQCLARTSTNPAGGAGDSAGISMPFTFQNEESAQTADSKFSGYNGYAHSFGGMSVQFILMAGIDWGILVLMERQKGLWRRLRGAPLSRTTLLAGRAASSTLIACSTLVICWAFSMVVFHVRVNGSWPGFIACNFAFSLFAASLGLFIAALGRTPEATRGIAIFVILILVMLGGAWVPAFIFPAWLQKVTLIIPTRWAVDGFDAMTWRGLGLRSALAPVAVLLGYAIVFSEMARRCFRWETD